MAFHLVGPSQSRGSTAAEIYFDVEHIIDSARNIEAIQPMAALTLSASLAVRSFLWHGHVIAS